MYIHEREAWPHFVWDQKSVAERLIHLRHLQGRLIGAMESIGFSAREESILQALTQDAVKSSEIEGEILDPTQVRSSVARHLGIESGALNKVDRHIEGVVEMILDATQKFQQPLIKERLFYWHNSLFPTGRSGYSKIRVGAWRKGPVHVISGSMGKEKIHFEGPEASRVDREMSLFLQWVNKPNDLDPVLQAAIAHLWFVTIHPFDDGNGRIGRAIADLLLARSEKSGHRFYSLSAQIQAERKSYYEILEKTQKGNLDITRWLLWFFDCLEKAMEHVNTTLCAVKEKARFWESIKTVTLNERQKKVINKLLDGFEGNLTTSKWAKICKCSQDTAHRDILQLVEFGILQKGDQGGRSTKYMLRGKLKSS